MGACKGLKLIIQATKPTDPRIKLRIIRNNVCLGLDNNVNEVIGYQQDGEDEMEKEIAHFYLSNQHTPQKGYYN